MSDKIRTGIAGCGYLGRHHARILTELPFSEPVGFVEANDATAAEIEAKHGAFGLVRCRSVKELLDRGATAVVVATAVRIPRRLSVARTSAASAFGRISPRCASKSRA